MLKHILVTVLVTLVTIIAYESFTGIDIESNSHIKLEKKFGEFADNPTLKPVIRLLSKGKFLCSGFVIDKNYAVTAAHCLVDDDGKLKTEKLKVESEENTTGPLYATIAGMASRSDLGLLLGDFSQFIPLKLQDRAFGFMTGDHFLTCGYPYGNQHLSCNIFVPRDNENFMVRGLGYLVPGMSGGPVIDAETNEVVGLNTAVGNGVAYVSPLQGILGAFDIDP